MKRFFVLIIFFLTFYNVFPQVSSKLVFSEGLAVHKTVNGKKSLYGFVNQKGKIIIEPGYDTIYAPFKNGIAVVGLLGKAGAIDKKGKAILPVQFYQIGEISRFAIAYKGDNGLWGFYNHRGGKIHEAVFQNFRYSGKNKIIVQQNGKWGVINDKGHAVIEINYKWIEPISEKHYRVWNMPIWSVRTPGNTVIFSVNFDSLRHAGNNRYVYSIIGKKGLLNERGNIVSEAIYDDLEFFRYGLIKTNKNGYGVIDANNKVIVPFKYDDLIIDSLYIRVMKRVNGEDGKLIDKWGLYDHKGKELIQPKYAFLKEFSDGLIAAKREEKTWGYIDPQGYTSILFRYADAGNFKNGRAEVLVPYSLSQREWPAIIDQKGDYVISPADYEFYKLGLVKIGFDNKSSLVIPKDKYEKYERIDSQYVRVGKNGLWGLISTWGREIVPPIYEKVSDPSKEGLIIVEKGGKRGVVDSKGAFTYKLSNRFEQIYGYNEGFSKFLLKGRYGFINRYGDVYISPQYTDAGIMSDSMVNVILRGKWAFIDYKEELKVQPYYEEVKPFNKGIALVKENGLWNIINKEGKEFHSTGYTNIEKIFSGKYLLYNNGKMGMADERGREILAPKYEYLSDTGLGYVLVKRNGLWGALDYRENFIVPIEFDAISFVSASKVFITTIDKKQHDVHVK